MEYLINGRTYSLSYSELKDKHQELDSLSDEQFLSRLPEVLHLCCIICWFKEIPSGVCLSDEGIIHQIAHVMHLSDSEEYLKSIRKDFTNLLKLA